VPVVVEVSSQVYVVTPSVVPVVPETVVKSKFVKTKVVRGAPVAEGTVDCAVKLVSELVGNVFEDPVSKRICEVVHRLLDEKSGEVACYRRPLVGLFLQRVTTMSLLLRVLVLFLDLFLVFRIGQGLWVMRCGRRVSMKCWWVRWRIRIYLHLFAFRIRKAKYCFTLAVVYSIGLSRRMVITGVCDCQSAKVYYSSRCK